MRGAVVASLCLGVLAWAPPGLAGAGEPVRTVEDSLSLPPGMDADQALASVEDVARIFDLYEPVVPRIPGVRLDLDKTVVSEAPAVVEMPVSGTAVGFKVEERARVAATSRDLECGAEGDGRMITLDFGGSSFNIHRRIDRIEISACPERDASGAMSIRAIGRLYEGFMPKNPEKSQFTESIGAEALQTAFIKQVPAVLDAVRLHWQRGAGW